MEGKDPSRPSTEASGLLAPLGGKHQTGIKRAV